VQAIFAIQLPKGVKQLQHFLGMVQYNRDLWARLSKMLAPLTSLVGECHQTKVTKAKGTKKLPWHWDEVHQRAFDHAKAKITKEVVSAYPNCSKVFEIYTCFQQTAQSSNYSGEQANCVLWLETLCCTTQIQYHQNELLAIIKALQEFKGMLWGQSIKVFTDHKKSHERCSRLNLRPSVPMEVTAGRV
jgi:hypothetical protein